MNAYKFPNRDTFRTLAAAEGLIVADDRLLTDGQGWSIDEIGIITTGGEWDAETGEEITAPVALDGWHVNSAGLAPEAWDPYLVVVNHPVRVFAGGPTQAPDTPILEEIVAS